MGSNKCELIDFLATEWSTDKYAPDLIGRNLFVTVHERCLLLTSDTGSTVFARECEELICSHEEADTRLLLHAKHASDNGHQVVVVKSQDTDVAVLAFHFSHEITARLYLLTGRGSSLRMCDATATGAKLGADVCNALLGMHAFTGCDSTSAFSGKGKKLAFDLISHGGAKGQEARRAMIEIGKSFQLSEEALQLMEQFTCALYGRPQAGSINTVRYELFCRGKSSSSQLPPCQDALMRHARRANHQAGIWRRSLQGSASVPLPHADKQGWLLCDSKLDVDWLGLPPAPQSLLEFVSCGCKKGCESRACSCLKQGLKCTDACRCSDECCNVPGEESEELGDDVASDGDEDHQES